MVSTSKSDQDKSPLWKFVSISDYSLPAPPVSLSARKGLSQFWRLIRDKNEEEDSFLKAVAELRTLPASQLERIAPLPDWRHAAEALIEELKDWLNQDNDEPPVHFLVGPPYSGRAEILAAAADRLGWQVITPPSPDQLMAGDGGWFSDQKSDNAPWVFPNLEKTFLRHARGLNVIRHILDQANSRKFGPGIIGCDSWSWPYLKHIWRGRRPVPLTLQAFDQTRQADYLREVAYAEEGRDIRFRQADNGKYILPPVQETEGNSYETSGFLELLAGHSRGILGIALAIWRNHLRAESDELVAEEREAKEGSISEQTIWVTPWEQIKFPSIPAGAGRDEAFVLHSLLLHNGLLFEVLCQVIPIFPSQVMETLYVLEEVGLVARQEAGWLVTASGYPAVREFLDTNGYMVDQF